MLDLLDVKHNEKSLFLRGSRVAILLLAVWHALAVVRFPYICQLSYSIPFAEIIIR